MLMTVERGLLKEFFGRFRQDLEKGGVALPDAALPDDKYAGALAMLTLAPDRLPLELNEALHAIDDMATAEARARLLDAVQTTRLRLDLRQDSSDLDLAIQLWLRAPALFARKHAELQTSRFCNLQYFEAVRPVNRSGRFAVPDDKTLAVMTADIDAWYARRHKGIETTSIEVYPFEDAVLFLIRHGDTYVRAMTAERRQRQVIHYRPEKDDLVVYVPALDELRVTAQKRGEQRLYRECFGYHLFQDLRYFSPELTFTLAPLLSEGEHVLDVHGLKGVHRITLTEIHVDLDSSGREVNVLKSDDLFARAAKTGQELFPDGCTVTRAVFAFHLVPGEKPYAVHVCPPNKLKVAHGCDVDVVHRWLLFCKFRVVRATNP